MLAASISSGSQVMQQQQCKPYPEGSLKEMTGRCFFRSHTTTAANRTRGTHVCIACMRSSIQLCFFRSHTTTAQSGHDGKEGIGSFAWQRQQQQQQTAQLHMWLAAAPTARHATNSTAAVHCQRRAPVPAAVQVPRMCCTLRFQARWVISGLGPAAERQPKQRVDAGRFQ